MLLSTSNYLHGGHSHYQIGTKQAGRIERLAYLKWNRPDGVTLEAIHQAKQLLKLEVRKCRIN